MWPAGITGLARRDILRVLTARRASDTWTLYAARTPSGEDYFWLVPPRLPGSSGFPSGICDIAAGAPAISSCGVTGTAFEPVAQLATLVGRITEGVVRVEARYESGGVETATVENGWFVLFLPKGTGPKEVVALAADGTVLGRLGSPLEPRAFHPGG